MIMVSMAATSAFLPIASQVSGSSGKTPGKIGGSVHANIDSRGNSKSRYLGFKVKASAQEPPRGNGSKVGGLDGFKSDYSVTSSPPARTFVNQLLRPDMLVDPFGPGRIVQDGLVFRQNFSIRSYEVGADRTASVETVMNHFQETSLNHVKDIGLFGDGFGCTPEMCKKNLIWVITKMQVVVDRYPMWGDVVQVDTWVAASGKNGMRRDWLSAPSQMLETYELAGMTLEYRRECMRDSVLQSLSSVVDNGAPGYVECQHLLRLEGGGEIFRGRTQWRPKYPNDINNLGQLPVESA
ncbi:hypothetical protein RD792_005637 [Penstemon davidsonii]|uniref:Acyl-[acyl-carrier-protein] hydrolase n=1 Tax=Penstemon davidsonii TaxID=160366 RepID=A0ABR0DEP9_9LAMI|nr:hypothetical protein RD792_005637 [Penstemon davidsonii]